MSTHRIAVIPGDGIGTEVVPEGLRVLDAAAAKFGIGLALRSLRFRELRLLPEARQNDAGQLEGADRRPRRDLLRSRRLAGQGPRSHFLMGLAAAVPPRVRSIRQPAPRAADARASRALSPIASPATSTSTWCARTPRANTRRSAARCFPARSAKWCSRRPSSRASAWIAS